MQISEGREERRTSKNSVRGRAEEKRRGSCSAVAGDGGRVIGGGGSGSGCM